MRNSRIDPGTTAPTSINGQKALWRGALAMSILIVVALFVYAGWVEGMQLLPFLFALPFVLLARLAWRRLR
ncbi:MAG: hypothetical protein M3451_07440 [Chloroflexota bacterium]|nr:hypothetical protein [Chloroflexota bacterium]